MSEAKLADRSSRPLPAGTPPLSAQQITQYLKQVSNWKKESGELVRSFKFENYYETMSFVVAVAMLAQREDHHPDMEVGYNRLKIRYSTHSVGGLSENDFICAAKIDALMHGG